MRSCLLSVVAALALWPWAVGAQQVGIADLDDFALETGQDLVDLCAVEEGLSSTPRRRCSAWACSKA